MSYKYLKVPELRDLARSLGLRGWSGLRRSDLISFIIDNEDRQMDRASEDAKAMSKMSVSKLRSLARFYEVKERSKANKAELIYLLRVNHGE